MKPDRIAAVIIHDGKLLLVKDAEIDHFYTPGGKVEVGESHEATLVRELQEELKVRVASMKHYLSYRSVHEQTGKEMDVHCYLVRVDGDVIPSAEIVASQWFSKEKLSEILVPIGIKKHLIPKILADGLLE
jgi:8-oxo-dGTP diphosphatase